MAIRVELGDDFLAALESRTAAFQKDLEAAKERKAAEKALWRRRVDRFNKFTEAVEDLTQAADPLKRLTSRGKDKAGKPVYTFTLKGWEASFLLDQATGCCTAMKLYEISFLLKRRKT
jgi:hypothetical protein